MSRTLKDFTYTETFVIIDDWTHQVIEELPRDKAIIIYGDCEVTGSYTSGWCGQGFKTDVWVRIPGMKIGYWNDTNLHLRWIGTEDRATFIGAKSGLLITVEKFGADDYSVWWRDVSEGDDETAGYSVRGTAEEIIKELEGEI